MINYTTPTITLTIKNADITSSQAYVTLKQSRRKLTKGHEDLTVTKDGNDTKITFGLSQEESASFDYGTAVNVQVNWITSAGVRGATQIKKIPVMRNLLDEVKEYVD